ncbi:hypothetical protein [Mesonia aestuariivivens]|uniref:NlpE C-terminal OB domain-containing protein n=1 Tax=Mesonia aestuariivivens TaxID=2796128 RepID=A0ABS6W207_9FLAO|nr:hypothetical protein [Mesonia aestuariivivens]MBW2961893.1 hypothetical protein [Mesonia aestuariivivens]
MKKIIITLLAVSIVSISCKDEEKKASDNDKVVEKVETISSDGEVVLSGEYIYTEDAAVLKGDDFIYGVELDEMAKKLASQVEEFKREDYDMIPVILKGKIKENPNKDGWEKIVEIKNIIKVSEPTSEPAIKVKGE